MRHNYAILTALAIIFLIPGCPSHDDAFKGAVQTASISAEVYEVVSSVYAKKMGILVKKFNTDGKLSKSEQTIYKKLRAFQKPLEAYGEAHQAFVEAIRAWKVAREQDPSASAPTKVIDLIDDIQRFIKEANDIREVLAKVPDE